MVLLTHTASLSTLHDTQYALMMHETRLDQLNPPTQTSGILPTPTHTSSVQYAQYSGQNRPPTINSGRSSCRGRRGGRGR